MAFWDAFGKRKNLPLYKIWDLEWRENLPLTDYTIGIGDLNNLIEKLNSNPWPVYKLKVGDQDDIKNLIQLRKYSESPFRIDANGGWSIDEAQEKITQCSILNIELIEDIDFPNKYGNFRLAIFQHNWEDRQSIAIYSGDIKGANALTTRIHSQCFTGDIFGSFRCDCGDQLDQAMQQMAQENKGLLIYLQQEGRGIGLVNKIKAYKLQETGLDTVEANLKLGFKAELRDYASAAQILRYYGIPSIKLLTNNPSKVEALKSLGYTQVERQAIVGNINAHNEHYIMTKKARMGHLINNNNLKQQ
jgi:GTP cyclohydrolase II